MRFSEGQAIERFGTSRGVLEPTRHCCRGSCAHHRPWDHKGLLPPGALVRAEAAPLRAGPVDLGGDSDRGPLAHRPPVVDIARLGAWAREQTLHVKT